MLPGLLRQMHPSSTPAENDQATPENRLYQIYMDHTTLAADMRPLAIQHNVLIHIIRFFRQDGQENFDYQSMKYFLERKGPSLEGIFGILQRIRYLASLVSNAISLKSICKILMKTDLLVQNGTISFVGQNILDKLILFCDYLNIRGRFTADKFIFLIEHYHTLSKTFTDLFTDLMTVRNPKIRLFVLLYLDKIEKNDDYYMVLLFAVLPEQLKMEALGWKLTIKDVLDEYLHFNQSTIKTRDNLNYFHDFLYLKKVVDYYTNLTPKVSHGLFSGQLPRNLREINAAIAKFYKNECGFQQLIENIIYFSSKMGTNHPILQAANKLESFDCNDQVENKTPSP